MENARAMDVLQKGVVENINSLTQTLAQEKAVNVEDITAVVAEQKSGTKSREPGTFLPRKVISIAFLITIISYSLIIALADQVIPFLLGFIIYIRR